MNLPVTVFFSRSLKESTRQLRTYIIRAVLLLATFVTLVSAELQSLMFSAPGLLLFGGVAYLNLILICLAAPGYFASVITEEKEAGTLGLLKMAGLGPVSILLGKSTSQALGAATLLLVQVPFTVLAVTLGGVSLRQVFAGYVTMLAFLLFMANMALFFSVVCRHSARASTLCVLFLLAFFFGPALGHSALVAASFRWPALRSMAALGWAGDLVDMVRRASPFDWMGHVLRTGFRGPLAGYQVWSNLALAAGFFLLGWAAFNRFTREQTAEAPARGLLGRRTRFLRLLGPGRAWRNALAWKDFHFLSGGNVSLVGRAVLMGLVPVCAYLIGHFLHTRPRVQDVGGVIVAVSLILLFLELTLLSARIFGEERKWRTLSGIMALPHPAWQVVLRKAFGYGIGLAPYGAWFILGAILMGDAFPAALRDAVGSVGFWFSLVYCAFFFHLVAYISLILRRGAILLAFAICFFGSNFLFTPLALLWPTLGEETFLAILLGGTLVAIVILHRRIAFRLRRAAELE